MKNLKIEILEKKCERLIVRLTVEFEDDTKDFMDLDMSGNLGTAPFYYGSLIVKALNKMQEEFNAEPGDPDYDSPCPTCGQ